MVPQSRCPEDEPRHPIQVVSRRTGLSAHAIRAWERRYGAVSPERSNTRRRLYSDAEVERLRLLRRATAAGRRIGDVAPLSTQQLAELVGSDEAAVAQAPSPARPAPGTAREHFEACLSAAKKMDPALLESALNKAAVSLSIPVLLDDVISPLMEHIGEGCREGSIRVSHEHMATAVVRSFIGPLASTSNMTRTGPPLLITTPMGQGHEIGALMVAVTAAAGGWVPVYLGPNVPADEIAFAAEHNQAKVVALSIVYPADDPRLPGELQRLRRNLSEGTEIIVGGASAPGYQNMLDEVGARVMDNLDDLRVVLDQLRDIVR